MLCRRPLGKVLYQDGLKRALGPNRSAHECGYWPCFEKYSIIHCHSEHSEESLTYGQLRQRSLHFVQDDRFGRLNLNLCRKKKVNILLVEDDNFLIDIYKRSWKWKGLRWPLAITEKKCLIDVKAQTRPDSLDILLPKLDGFAVLGKTKKPLPPPKISPCFS